MTLKEAFAEDFYNLVMNYIAESDAEGSFEDVTIEQRHVHTDGYMYEVKLSIVKR